MKKTYKKKKIFLPQALSLGVAVTCVGTSSEAVTIWTDADSPKGREWINIYNPSNGGDVHIQNNNTFY